MTNDEVMDRALQLVEQYFINGQGIVDLRALAANPDTVFAVVAGEARVPIMRNVGESAFNLQIEAAEAGQLHCVNELKELMVGQLIGPVAKVIGLGLPDDGCWSTSIQMVNPLPDGTELYIK